MRFLSLTLLAALALTVPVAAQSGQQESVAEAARKAREKRKAAAQAKKTFTNEDISADKKSATEKGEEGSTAQGEGATAATTGSGAAENPEQKWRKAFAEAREKLANAEKELAILQRELEQNRVQYYPDPQKTLEQETLRTDINEKRKKIEEKQKEVTSLRQAIEDLERQMRAEGGQPGWARQ